MIETPGFSVCCSMILLLTGSALAGLPTPPPPPRIPAIVSASYSLDLDKNRVDDDFQRRPDAAKVISDLVIAGIDLHASVSVELVFTQQITQQQIDTFVGLGGTIDYVYRAVSYGWQGRIARGVIDSLPLLMGDALLLVKGPKPMCCDMDIATQTGRVRPIWGPGFAGNSLGFDGDPSITIGIIDSGVDGTHPDLAGRMAHWIDESGEGSADPVDYDGHGSHVAAIAVGTGDAGGSVTDDPFAYTYTGSEPNTLHVAPGVTVFHNVNPLADTREFPQFHSTAYWDGGTATLNICGGRGGNLIDYRGCIGGSLATTGSSPLSLRWVGYGAEGYVYRPCLMSVSENESCRNVVIRNWLTKYPGAGDGFNRFRGVAPACRWAAAKVAQRDGLMPSFSRCEDFAVCRALDYFTEHCRAYGIKVINISLGTSSEICNTVLADKANTAVSNGIVVTLSAGNHEHKDDGLIRDFKYASKAITTGASNDENALAAYSRLGRLSPPTDDSEDHKPDVLAPGGSPYFTGIISVDSGTCDGPTKEDQQADDYAIMQGTSMAAGFVSGCAGLVIDAMQQNGTTWSFASDAQPRYVKMILCATATETGRPREDGAFLKELEPQRGSGGPGSFPRGKDPYEGYGLINPDAAVEAVSLRCEWNSAYSDFLGEGRTDRRAWARAISPPPPPTSGTRTGTIHLQNPPTGDFDLYVYDSEPDPSGNPGILHSSTWRGNGHDESVRWIATVPLSTTRKPPSLGAAPSWSGSYIVVVKRVSGYGSFALTTSYDQ